MVPFCPILFKFVHLQPENVATRLLRFPWNFAHVDRNLPAFFDLCRTGEVRHGHCGTDDEATKLHKAISSS